MANVSKGTATGRFIPHVFRKFFFTNAVGAMGETATHAMMGHSFYPQTHYRRPPLEDSRGEGPARAAPARRWTERIPHEVRWALRNSTAAE